VGDDCGFKRDDGLVILLSPLNFRCNAKKVFFHA
jgi:hypothetical protein